MPPKITIIPKGDTKEEAVKAFLIKRQYEKWANSMPKNFWQDVEELTDTIVMFNMTWGTNLSAEDIVELTNKK